jgi:hypothetical protein
MVQASDEARRSAAEAALESILHLCRWTCEPLQVAFDSQQDADTHANKELELLLVPAVAYGSGSSGSSLCAAAMAAAGFQQVQRCALGLASVLTAAAGRGSAAAAPRLAAVARLLQCMCSGSSSWPVTVECFRSRSGQQLLRTRVAAPVAALNAAASWFADGGLLSRLLHTEVHDGCSNHQTCR